MIRALAFDFDGLILDTETPIVEAWAEVHARAGLSCDRRHVVDIVGHVDIEHDPWTAFAPEIDRHELERQLRVLKTEYTLRQSVLPGIHEYLAEAKVRGLRLAIASNSPHRWVDRHLERLGLLEQFDVVLCRDDVEKGKPDPELYRKVTHALGVAPAEAVAFEDSAPGSIAAVAAGLWCVTVPNPCTRRHDFSHAHLTVDSLAGVKLSSLLDRFGAADSFAPRP
jgi:HAD superfamily hydrolase (TIGR01509 family)